MNGMNYELAHITLQFLPQEEAGLEASQQELPSVYELQPDVATQALAQLFENAVELRPVDETLAAHW